MSDIRIGDEDRMRAADRLAEHAAAGRLTVDELEQRLERANAAVYAHDLQALEADLPGPPAPRPAIQVPWVAVLLVVAAIAATIAVGHPFPPLLILAFILWRRQSAIAWSGRSGPVAASGHRR
jgi:hypothetical protein